MTIVHKLAKLLAQDAHAVRTLNQKTGRHGYPKVSSPLTGQAIDEHLSRSNPEHSLGAYLLSDLKKSMGHVIVFDFDDHDGDNQEQTDATAVKFSRILENLQCPHLIFRSGGGDGYHIYLVFEEAHPKSWLRAVGKHLLCEKAQLKEGSKGVVDGEIEIFPKNDGPGGQNVIALPLARKSVALAREDDKFIEIDPPTEIPFCVHLNNVKDPGYRKASRQKSDPRTAFLKDLLKFVDTSSYANVRTDPTTNKKTWQKGETELSLSDCTATENVIGVNLITDTADDKGHACVIGVREGSSAAAISAALTDSKFTHFTVTSASGEGFYVWCVSATARRRDQLRKIANDAVETAGADGAVIYPTNQPVELPLCGESRFVRSFKDGDPQFGPPPNQIPADKGRKSGPTAKSPDKDLAFECLIRNQDPNDYDVWVRIGHIMIAAFGKDDDWAFEKWAEWSGTADNPDNDDELFEKWQDKLDAAPDYSPVSFWMAAKDNGYDGALPFNKKDEEKFRCLDVIDEVELFRSQDDIAFATIGPRHHVQVSSKAFENHIRMRSYSENGSMLSAEVIKTVTATIEAKCLTNKTKHEVFVRVARHGNKGYLFLGDDDHTVIEYDADGFRVCEDPPVRFRQTPGSLPIPAPEHGELDELQRLFNVNEENWALLLSWKIMTLVNPGRPTPICVLNGEHGSAKTTALKHVTSLIDPKIGATSGPAKSEDDLIASAYSSYIVSADNVSSFYQLADPWCRLATGGGLRKRSLYTNNGLAAYDVIRPVLTSGIDPATYQQDLIERLLTIELSRPEIYMSEADVSQRFESKRTRGLGALLTLAGQIMAQPKPDDIEHEIRMADFAIIGELVARHLRFEPGWFTDTYKEMLEAAAAENAEGDHVFTFLERFLIKQFSPLTDVRIGLDCRIKSSDLQQDMAGMVKRGELVINLQDVPRNARAMSTRVFRLQKQLKELGIACEKMSSDRSWRFEINDQRYVDFIIGKKRAEEEYYASLPY